MQNNLRDLNNLVFTIETNIKNVMNALEITTTEEIRSSEIRYIDEYGYEKVAQNIGVETTGDKVLLTFDHFYTNKFDLVINGDISESSIQGIKIIPLNQKEFYEEKDIDLRLDKTDLAVTSLCGQYSNNAPKNAIDGDESTTFHSANYTGYAPGTHGDFVIDLGKPYLLDKLQLRTRSSGNGRIRAYEVLYRTTKTEDWKKVFEQLTEESGINREATFKPVLASEVCIRVTNGSGNFVVIAELDLFKYNFIDARISNLFTDETETVIKPGVTLEEIELLEAELVTPSYIERVAKAKELYIKELPKTYFAIPLSEEKIFDKVQFTTTERVLKVDINYKDAHGIQRVIENSFESNGTLYTLNLKKIMTSEASIVMYGVSKIENISINNYDRLQFCIDEDIDLRITSDKITGSTTHPNNSYPISNMFDGNINSQFHCTQYESVGYCDVYFKLDKEYLIDKLSLISYRTSTSGLINKFRVLAKEMNSENSWADLGEYTVESYSNKWLDVKNETPYLTDEICLRIEDSVNGWALVSELELFIHSNLEKRIDNLFLDDSYETLKESVTYEEILALEAKNLVTPEFVEKVVKARELYILRLPQNSFSIPLDGDKIFDKIQFVTSERVLRAHFKYTDTYGVERLVETDFEGLGNIYTLNIKKVETSKASLVLYGVSNVDSISTNSYNRSEFYINEDIDLRLTSDKITVSTEKPNNSYPASNLFDGNINSQFHCNQTGDYCDIFFKLDKAYLMDRLRLISYRSNTSGLINEFKVFLKEMNTENEWVELGDYKVESYQNKWLEVKGKPYLTDEVCLRIEDSVNGWTLINELELLIHSNLEQDIRNLFEDEECEILKDNVTYQEILTLEARVVQSEDYKALVLKAKNLYLERKPDLNFVLETDRKNVMNQIKVVTSGKIYRSEVSYQDEHGYEIKLEALEIEEKDGETILTFDTFYCDKFNLMLDGDITDDLIQNIKITQLNQNNFYENKDVDVRLSKNDLVAISHCGQFEDNSPDKAIDGSLDTGFHSSTYSGSYGDFVVELGKDYVIDRVRFTTRADNEGQGNGRIRAYEILYKNRKSDEWRRAFQQLTDESGNDREAKFEPILATEICIRVTNGKNKYVVIKELDIFKYNYIDERIASLFTDKTERELKIETTLNDIESLQSEITTKSYLDRLENAKELYILRLPQNYVEIGLNEEKIFDRVQFTSSDRVLRAHIKYTDVYGVERLVESNLETLGNIYTLNINKVMTSNASLVIYGEARIENIVTNSYDRLQFCIDEDIDLRITSDKITASTTHPNNSYPISNMFDGNINSQFHCTQYESVGYCDVYFKLDKEYLIDKLSLISYRTNTSGLINKFRVLAKEMNSENSWAELGEYTVESYSNKWLDVKNETSYLTDEICLRIEDSVNKWALVSELELFIHSNVEKRIENLFSDDSYETLREGVTYEEILALEAKNLVTPQFIEKVAKARELYILGLSQNSFSIPLDGDKIFDKIQFVTSERVLRAHFKYTDTYGVERLIETDFEGLGNIYTLNIKKVETSKASLVLYGVSNVDSISTNSYNRSEFYINEDIDLRLTSDKITVSTEKPNSSYPASNLFDGNINSQFHCNQTGDYCDIFFKLDKAYLMDRLRLISYRSSTSGLINEFKVFLKEMNTENEWVELGDYKVESYQNEWLEVKGKPYLTDEVCLRVEDSVNGWTLINELELLIHSNLEQDIRNLFEDEECEILKDNVTYQEILALEARVIVTEDYRALVLKAKELYLNKKSPVKFNLEIDEERVINQIKITTSGKIYDAEICYVDSHGHTKKSEILNIETKETETLLTFIHLYSKDFNLSIRGDIVESEIENIRIVQLNQKDFYENQDIDVRLNKELLTAVSYCGQHGDNAPSHIFDGDYSTTFHSSNYTGYAPGTYGDLVIEMDRPYLLDRVQMRTRTSGNGRIKAYEVLYKTSKAEDWKKVFDQLTEESGDDREAKFNPVLATEICIRVKNGHGNFIVISEMDIFKYNTIEARIADLFLDKDETILKPGITLEEIEAFERELRTASYRERVANAKQLYVDKLPLKEFEVPLVEELILNRIRFKTESRISKAKLKYVDNYSVEKIIDVNCAAIGDEYVLVFEPIVAKNLVILLYGLDEINSISVNTLNKLDFCIDEDIDLRIPYEKMVCSTTHPNSGYPISNMFDGDMNSQFHCTQYTDYCDVYFKLDKEYLIDRLRLKSFRLNESGFIKKFRVLLKDLNLEETWTDLGEYVVETHEDKWLAVEGKPYLTNEVCLRIEDSINGWALINELELFIHSNLEASIDDLFTNEELVELREGVTYDEIIELQNKATTTLVYKEKIKKAKELYLQKVTKKNYKLNYEFNFILDEVVVNYKALLESKVDYKLEYISTLGEKIEIENFEVTQKDDRSISLKFEKILTNNIELIIGYIDESESWKSSYIKTIEIDQTPYYCLDDIGIDYDKALITPNSLCGIHSSLYPEQNMLDGDRDTYFRSKKMGKVEFIFEEPKVINEFWVDVNHNNGRINKAKLYYKEFEEQEWIYLRDYETDNPISGVTSLTFAPVLAKKFCIEVESSYSNIILFSEVGFKVYSLLEAKVNALFEENSLFKVLKKNITLEKIEHLKSMTKENKFLKAKLEIATMILKNSGKFPIKTYNYKSIEEDSSHYFGLTVSNNTGNIVLSHHYIQPNTDYVFILNRDIEVAVMTYTKKPESNRTFKLSKGMNIINIPEQGHMIFRGSRKEEIEYYSLNKENGLVYRYGYTKAKDLFDKNDILNEVEEGHYSNTAYVEGKTYIGAIKFDWLKNGFKSENLSKHIEIFDEYLDFIHYLDNVHGYFKQQMPYKRLLWLGLNSDPMHAGGSFAGGYTAYSGSSGPMVPVSTYNMANSWAIGHELGHELDSNDYLMGLFGEVTNNWFAEQPRQEYMKTIRTKNNVRNLAENPYSVYEMGFFDKLAIFYKLRLFYTDNSFFQKMNALMQENRANSVEEAADNFAKFSTQILKRDMSAYYIKYGFELSEEAIAWCGQYPAPAIDLQHITWENHEEFVKEEIKLFNQKYKSVSKIK